MNQHGTDVDLTRRLYAAYRDPGRAVLEGFHPTRHAIRFGARLEVAVTYDPGRLWALADRLAPDAVPEIERVLCVVDRERFGHLSQRSLSSPLLSVCARPTDGVPAALADRTRPVVHLERPRDPGNVGAVIRVAAAAGAGAVLVSGQVDPWSPVVLRSATGLQFAVPVGTATLPLVTDRPIVAVAVGGEPVETADLPPDAVLVVGGERYGLSDRVRALAHRSVGIPMWPGVSSLNLATSVAAVLFSWRSAALARTGAYPW
ncbi:MAG: TrmH family RNA methyltransferase [Acidimicrobiales bacterium]